MRLESRVNMLAPDGSGGDLKVSVQPVFFDPTQRRWLSFVTLSLVLVFGVAAILGILSLSIYQSSGPLDTAIDARLPPPVAMPAPALPTILEVTETPVSESPVEVIAVPDTVMIVPPTPPARPAAAPEPPADDTPATAPAPDAIPTPSFIELVMGAAGNLLVSPANATEFTATTEPRTYAFHVNWSPEGIASLKENILRIDTLLPQWVYVADENGGIDFDLPDATETILEDIADENPAMRIVPVLTDLDSSAFHPDRIAAVLADPQARQALIGNVRDYLLENGFEGIAIRFSSMETVNAAHFAVFLRALDAALTPLDLSVYAVLPAEADLPLARSVVGLVDAIIVEGWGETLAGQQPGPLASQDWFSGIAAAWQSAIPAQKLVLALRNIAYDWPAGSSAQQISTLEALNRARLAGETVTLDAQALNTRFAYRDAVGIEHDVWMLDAVSTYNQLRTAMQARPRGFAIERLGNEDSAIWDLLDTPALADPSMLEMLDYGTQISRQGAGEIIKVVHEPQAGTRDVTVSASGLVTGARVATFPRSFEIAHWGGSDPKAIALTFDDGPDPEYTAAILDILAAYEVPASFFATGAQMMRHPGMVERIVAEGHEVGSHTYSHTNISSMSPEMLRFDLNATQRVFESITGRSLLLFRAPYAVDANPQVAAEIAPIATVSELGYLTVNMNIDPKDWWAPNAERIHATTLRQVEAGLGNIVLLHDAGGNRSQTVEALPRIIEDLRARGYRFVTASELVGLTPDDVMPVSARAGGVVSAIDGMGFSLLRFGEMALSVTFMLAIGLGISRAVLLIILSALRKRPAVHLRPATTGPKVGIIVPAYNEEKVVANTVRSLLASTYRNYEILIVDDGSRDGTVAACEREFGDDPRVRIFTKPNGGKSSALNFGFARTDAEIVVALDADTIFDPHTIGWLAARFVNPKIGAVAGNAKVGNRINLLTRWQATEYITSQNLDRRAFEFLNCVTVVPGAVGAWRREAVLALGGFTSNTLAEDADLTIRLLRAGHKVVYEERAIALTEAPETSKQLFKQRFRWMFGMLQTTVKHSDALTLRDSRSVGLIALPHIFVFQILFSFVAPVADIVALVALGDLAIKVMTDSSMMSTGQIAMFLALFFSFIVLDFMTGVAAFRLERNEDWRLLLWLPLQRFYYRQLLYLVALKALMTAIRGTLVGWGNLARTASVTFDATKPAR